MRNTLLVTGGSGFIGSAFIRSAALEGTVINVDAGTYAADIRRLQDAVVETIALDVTSPQLVDLFVERAPNTIVHFAAETHVTRGETDPSTFARTNIEGTRMVLDAALRCAAELVVHVSTDEVYGPATDRPFREEDKEPGEGLATSSYARSKAIADDLAIAAFPRLPVIVVRPTNCFGPWQHPEKAIPRWTIRALRREPVPVWGDGGYVRDWMYVDDASDAITRVITGGTPGQIYNIGPEGDVLTNLEIATRIAATAGASADSVYLSEYDRPAHDRRYSVDASKVRALGWAPQARLDERLEQTVEWYRANRSWWEPLAHDAEALYEDAQPRSGA